MAVVDLLFSWFSIMLFKVTVMLAPAPAGGAGACGCCWWCSWCW